MSEFLNDTEKDLLTIGMAIGVMRLTHTSLQNLSENYHENQGILIVSSRAIATSKAITEASLLNPESDKVIVGLESLRELEEEVEDLFKDIYKEQMRIEPDA